MKINSKQVLHNNTPVGALICQTDMKWMWDWYIRLDDETGSRN